MLKNPTKARIDDFEGSLVLYLRHISGLSYLPYQNNRKSFVALRSRMTKLMIRNQYPMSNPIVSTSSLTSSMKPNLMYQK